MNNIKYIIFFDIKMSERKMIRSLDDSERESTYYERKIENVMVVPSDYYRKRKVFHISINDIKELFPNGPFNNFLTGNFSQDPLVEVPWSTTSFEQLERWLKTGTIKNCTYWMEDRINNGFFFEGEERNWKEFFRWLGLTERQIDENVDMELPDYGEDDRTEEEMEQDEEYDYYKRENDENERERKEAARKAREDNKKYNERDDFDYEYEMDYIE
jgi:hypothetical protein